MIYTRMECQRLEGVCGYYGKKECSHLCKWHLIKTLGEDETMETIDEIKKTIRKDKNEKITQEVLRCVEEYNMDLADAKRLCYCWGLIDEEMRI